MSKKEKAQAPRTKAPAKPAAAAAPKLALVGTPGRSAEGLTMSPGQVRPAEETGRPVMSAGRLPDQEPGPIRPSAGRLTTADVPRKSSDHVEPIEPDWKVKGAELPKDDKGFVDLHATAEEFSAFRVVVAGRLAREKTKAPEFSYWRCPRCGDRQRSAADSRGGPCFKCNPRLLANGSQMTRMNPIEVSTFLVDEARWQEATRRNLELARRILRRRDQEQTSLRKAAL